MKKFALAAMCLILILMSGCDMQTEKSPVDNPEIGTYNLTAAPLTVKADDAAGYVFYTNSTQIVVEVPVGANGNVMLYDVAVNDSIQSVNLNNIGNRAVFSGLSAVNRYRIVCEGFEEAEITISD